MVLTDRVLMVVCPGKLNSRLVFPFIYILFACIHSLTSVPINIISVFGILDLVPVSVQIPLKLGDLFPSRYMFRSLAYGYLT